MPPAFREDRLEALHEVMRRNPLATLITAAAGLAANHVPMLIDPEGGSKGLGVLRAHLARANAQTKLAGEVDALVLFLEVDHYVTPSWYETKRQTGRVVPTWNYVAVHATGRLRVVDDPAWLRRQIEALTAEHEGRRATPWAVSDAPEDFVVAQMRAIVGIEIDILDLQGKWKLSQNRTEADRRGVADGLGREDDASGRIMAGLIDRGNPT
jgi:transcriptional regulator